MTPSKDLLRRLYRALPGKRPLYRILRSVWTPPEPLFRHLWFRGPFRVRNPAGSDFLMLHHGTQIENEIFWKGLTGGWEGRSMELWLELVKQATSVADVGANTGLYALAARATNPGAAVSAFEPVNRVFARLEANCRLNEFQIRLFQAAVSDRDGNVPLYDPGAEHVLSAALDRASAPGDPETVQVEAVRLDTLVDGGALPAPDLLKIDVEGHETAVLRGMGHLLNDAPTLLIEVLSEERADEVGGLLDGLDYRIYDLDEAGPPRPLPTVQASSRFNLLLIRPDRAEKAGLPGP